MSRIGKTALVTGGARGIGFGISKTLAQSGFDLAICGRRSPEEVAGSLQALSALGVEVFYQPADVSNSDERQSLIAAIRERFGRLNVLVNNSGIAPPQRLDILEATEGCFELVLQVNLQGPYFLTQLAANWMIEQKKSDPDFAASIVFITSVSATVASTNRGEYCISKAGLAMAVRLWAVRLGEFGIPVYEVRPGVVATDMTAGVKEKYDCLIAQGLLVEPRWGTTEDIGKAVRALVSGEIPYATGQVLSLDGGMTLGRL